MTSPRFLDVSAEVDRLYQLPLEAFTAARNALAKRLKADQGVDASQHIRTLVKPSVTAWTINQLYWRHRPELSTLLLAGDALRLAQKQRLGGADVDVAPAMRARQTAIDTLLALAADLLKEAGHQPSPDLRQRLLTSLDALAAYGTGESAPRVGRLVEDVPPPGFAALAGLAPASGASGAGEPAGSTPPPRPPRLTVVARRERAQIEVAAAQAEAAFEAARTHAAQAAARLAEADAQWQAARQALADAQRLVDQATEREQAARAEKEQRKRDVAHAGLAVRDAERARDKAVRALKE